MVVLGLSGMQLSQEVISAEGNVTLGYLKQANIVVFSMKAAAEHNLDLVAGKPSSFELSAAWTCPVKKAS